MSRKLIVLAAVIGCLCCSFPFATAQQMPPRFQLIIRDNGSGIDTLTFGLDICATRCIDPLLGERELPPPPPTGVFDARFVEFALGAGDCMGQGLRLNLRYWSWPTLTDTFKIKFQPGDGGFPMHFSWPTDVGNMFRSLTMKDIFGGIVINVNMLADTSYDLAYDVVGEMFIFSEGIIQDVPLFDPCDPIDVREVNEQLPAEFVLRQNYPNPFNPSTTIEFDVRERVFVEIEVYDILGTLVKHLVSQDLSPATYSATWNGTDNSGNAVASGVYYVRMTAMPSHRSSPSRVFTATTRIVLLR